MPAGQQVVSSPTSTHFQDTVFSSLTSYWQATCSINLPFCLFRCRFCLRLAVSGYLSSCTTSKTNVGYRRRCHVTTLSGSDRLGFDGSQHWLGRRHYYVAGRSRTGEWRFDASCRPGFMYVTSYCLSSVEVLTNGLVPQLL